MKKNLSLPIALLLSLGMFAGCGGSSSKTTTAESVALTEVAPPATEASPAGTDAPIADTVAPTAGTDAPKTGNTSAAVDEYCKQADDLAKKLKAVMADPTNGDAAAVTASATKLTTDAAALMQSQPSDVAKITACSQKLTDAVKPGA